MGVDRGQALEIEVFTIYSKHGEPYMWVRAGNEYMMPYTSMPALFRDWEFTYQRDPWSDALEQETLTERWMEVYMPDCDAPRGAFGEIVWT